MKSFQVVFVAFAIIVQVFCSHPHHRSDEDGVDMDLATNFQKAWKQRMVSGQQQSLSSQQQQSYMRNQISRHSERLTQRSPIATNVLSMTKDNLMNFPLNIAMQALSEVCHTAIITETLKPTYAPELNEIQVHLMTESGNISVPLDQTEELMKSASSGLDSDNKKTVVYITSWKSNTNNQNDPLNVLRKAFQCRGTENLLVIDIGNFVDNYHALQTLNTEMVGQWIGDVLSQLKDNVQSSKLHLIGHGIGAHIAGAAGRKYRQNTGNLLPRITGLDPAMLCYKNYENVVELHKGDAQFVDIIHSNSYGLGNPVPMGDVDFYPNYRRTNTPGCDNVMCAHEMAVRYFAESVLPGYENNFIGMMKKMDNIQNSQTQSSYYGGKYSSFVPRNRQNIEQMYDGDSKEEQQVPMGYATPVNMKGIYYLNTNSQYPYGQNVQSGSAPQCMRGQSVSPVY